MQQQKKKNIKYNTIDYDINFLCRSHVNLGSLFVFTSRFERKHARAQARVCVFISFLMDDDYRRINYRQQLNYHRRRDDCCLTTVAVVAALFAVVGLSW